MMTAADAETLFGQMLDGAISDADIAQMLISMADRGETADEIAGAARAMRARMIPVTAPANAIDVCGTGGDGSHSLNVSTAVAIVVAACGVPVAKHGNRAASSKAGAADTLEASPGPRPHRADPEIARQADDIQSAGAARQSGQCHKTTRRRPQPVTGAPVSRCHDSAWH
jgi:anthranilate phosphoribosyltransferase